MESLSKYFIMQYSFFFWWCEIMQCLSDDRKWGEYYGVRLMLTFLLEHKNFSADNQWDDSGGTAYRVVCWTEGQVTHIPGRIGQDSAGFCHSTWAVCNLKLRNCLFLEFSIWCLWTVAVRLQEVKTRMGDAVLLFLGKIKNQTMNGSN